MCLKMYPSVSRGLTQEGDQQNQWISTPSSPWTAPRDPDNYLKLQINISFQFPPPGSSTKSATSTKSTSNFHHQTAAPYQHQHPASTTRQQHKISISFQLPPPGRSTKPALAYSFHHQAAAHISQPPARQSANQLLTLQSRHTHIMATSLLLFRYPVIIFFYYILVWAICTGIK